MSSKSAEGGEAARPELESEGLRGFDAIYEAHFAFVWRSLRRLGVPTELVEDAAQDVFVVVHRRLGDLRPDASARSWLFGITLRTARDYRRTQQRKRSFPQADLEREASEDCGPFERTAQGEAARVLDDFLATLDESKRAVFVLSELEEMTAPEIASALDVNLNTVYSRLRAARERFVTFVSSVGRTRV